MLHGLVAVRRSLAARLHIRLVHRRRCYLMPFRLGGQARRAAQRLFHGARTFNATVCFKCCSQPEEIPN
eukprot:5535197-Pyramimonas_sp.AAC.1